MIEHFICNTDCGILATTHRTDFASMFDRVVLMNGGTILNDNINLLKNKEYFKKTRYRLLDIINSYNPDCIYMSEFPECYEYILPPHKLMNSIYRKGRKYKIIETTHNNSFDFKNETYLSL